MQVEWCKKMVENAICYLNMCLFKRVKQHLLFDNWPLLNRIVKQKIETFCYRSVYWYKENHDFWAKQSNSNFQRYCYLAIGWTKLQPQAVSLFDQQPNREQQFLLLKFSIGLFSQKNHEFVGINRPTDFKILRFSIDLIKQIYLNRSIAEAIDPLQIDLSQQQTAPSTIFKQPKSHNEVEGNL